jgi:VanZ family protein
VGGAAAAFTVAAAFLLSLSMELLRDYLPTRTQSEFDLLMNTLGGASA